jgi:hypothetical protein
MKKSGMIIAGLTPDGELVESLEWPDHPWGVGVQFHPEFKSRPVAPHPLFAAFPDTESADLSGGVEFFRAKDELLVQSGFLRWDGEAKLLTSRDDVVTRVRDGENSAIQGAGFSADAARRSFSFANGPREA